MMLFINGTTSPWKPFDHAGGSETLAPSMVNTRDLGLMFNFYTPFFGNIFHSWILDTSPTIDSVSHTFSGVSISALFDCCFLILYFCHHSIAVTHKFIPTLSTHNLLGDRKERETCKGKSQCILPNII